MHCVRASTSPQTDLQIQCIHKADCDTYIENQRTKTFPSAPEAQSLGNHKPRNQENKVEIEAQAGPTAQR